jgi:hypothetical protein
MGGTAGEESFAAAPLRPQPHPDLNPQQLAARRQEQGSPSNDSGATPFGLFAPNPYLLKWCRNAGWAASY